MSIQLQANGLGGRKGPFPGNDCAKVITVKFGRRVGVFAPQVKVVTNKLHEKPPSLHL
jgi:hypothetical protein